MDKYPETRVMGLIHGGPKLAPGEASAAYRVRGAVEVLEWWASLQPEERGRLLERVHAGEVPELVRRAEEREAIRAAWVAGGMTVRDLAEEFGWSKSAVGRAVKGLEQGRGSAGP